MCGRFTLRTPALQLAQTFLPGLDIAGLPKLSARYNIAPTQPVLCVIQDQESASDQPSRCFEMLRWGLIPAWAKELSFGARTINARGETIAEKPSFRAAFKSRRCLVIADGYYEWKRSGKEKHTKFIHQADNGAFAMAGLWESNTKASPDGETVVSCTIVTTDSNAKTSDVHDRMPVILSRDDWDLWLDPDFTDRSALQSLIRPADDDLLEITPVSSYVNNVRNEGPQCVEG